MRFKFYCTTWRLTAVPEVYNVSTKYVIICYVIWYTIYVNFVAPEYLTFILYSFLDLCNMCKLNSTIAVLDTLAL